MATHKIQSRDGPLEISLPQTPKLLSGLKTEWSPHAFCVSFKLETDHTILMLKAEGAIEKYHMDAVVANELHSRKHRVIIVQPSRRLVVTVSAASTANLPPLNAPEFTQADRVQAPPSPSSLFAGELDEQLIAVLASAHSQFNQTHKQ